MKKDNRELLESLIQNRLQEAMKDGEDSSKAFEEAMKAIDRQLEIDKREQEMKKEELKLQHEKEVLESKQNFESKQESEKQEYEMDVLKKRNKFELEKETLKSNLDKKRDDANRKFQFALEEQKHENEMLRNTVAHEQEMKKVKMEANQCKLNTAVKVAEIAAAVILAPLMDFRCKEAFAEMICEFEKDYNFTTMAGRSLSALFKFKK